MAAQPSGTLNRNSTTPRGEALLCAQGRKTSSDRGLSLQVLKVNLLGHRKRIIASLADRPYEEPPAKPPRFSQLRVSQCLCPCPGLCTTCSALAGCFPLPFISIPFFHRAKPESVRNNCSLSNQQLSPLGDSVMCRGCLLRAQVLAGY